MLHSLTFNATSPTLNSGEPVLKAFFVFGVSDLKMLIKLSQVRQKSQDAIFARSTSKARGKHRSCEQILSPPKH